MRKLILTTILVLAATAASAQPNVKAGYANSTWDAGTGTGTILSGATVGVGYEINLNHSRSLALRPALTYTYAFKATKPAYNIKEAITDHALGLPVHVKFSLPVSDSFRVYLFAGPSLGYGLGYKIKETFTRDPNLPSPSPITINLEGTITRDHYSGKTTGTVNDPDLIVARGEQNIHLNRVDVAASGGAGVQWRGVFVEAGYDYGLLNRSKKTGTIKHEQINVSLGYNF